MQDIATYIDFFNQRRTDQRFGVLPGIAFCLLILALVGGVIFLAHIFADPPFFRWYYAKIWHQDRSSIFYHTTDIGKADWILWLTGAAVLFVSLKRNFGPGTYGKLWWHDFYLKNYFVFTSVAVSGLLTVLFKMLISRGRPRDTTPETEFWHSLPIDFSFGTTSFPSGHATTIGAFCMALALLYPRLRIALLFLAAWVGASRIIVGAHFPSDVIAGLAVGSLFTWIHARNFARKRLLFAFNNSGGLILRGMKSKHKNHAG